ncbi:response regulator [Gracilinema caldarium]|uniref:response regulator n=1 Tax=Gracilinema caldarium TaxID=215591 RepID=UPI0026EECAD2|nr:response regulator [Gracilinema caldarium]
MKRILIVDDEQPIVAGLSLLIKRYFSEDYTVVGSASSGREAIEKARELSPDILLMDVQMPGISGLEAIKTIVSFGGPKAFILITAYERFDIAREALSLGVCDYILKPVSRDRLETALRTASQYLERGRELEKLRLEITEQDHQLAPLIKDAFFYRIKNGIPCGRDMYVIKKALQVQTEWAVIILIFIRSAEDEPLQSLYKRITEHIQYKTEAVIGNLEDDLYAPVLLPLKQPAVEQLQDWLKRLESAFSAECSLGRLSLYPGEILSIEQVHLSWKSAFIQYMNQTSLKEGEALLPWPLSLDRELISTLMGGNLSQVQELYEEILSRILARGSSDTHSLHRLLSVITLIVVQITEKASISEQEIHFLLNYDELVTLWNAGLLSPFIQRARDVFHRIIEKAREKKSLSPTAKRALMYIENHFAEPISLEQVADILGMAPASLSRLFSEELGTGFARTLIEYRLKRAKELLRQGTISVKEVSIACGYQDPNYFTRLFKNWVGMTPTEYMEAQKKKGEGAEVL